MIDRLPDSRKPGYRRLIRGSGLLFGVRIGGAVCAYASQVLLARWIGAPELGIYVEAFSWCLILSAVATFGLGTAAVRFLGAYLERDQIGGVHGYIRRSRQLVSTISILVAGGAALAVLGFGSDGADGSGSRTLLIALLCVPFLSWLRLHQSLAHALSWFGFAFLPHMLLRPAFLLLGIWIAWVSGWLHSAADAMGLHLLAIVVVMAGQAWWMRHRLRGTVPATAPIFETRLWLRTSAPLFLLTLYTQYFPELNVVLLGACLGDGEVAVFSMAFRTAMLIAFGLSAVDAIHMPAVARFHAAADPAAMQEILVRSTRIKFGCALAALAVLAVFGREVLALFGPDFPVGYPVLLILAGVQVTRAASGPVGEILSVTGHQDRSLLTCVVSLGALVAIQSALLPSYGIIGGAWGVLLVVLLSQLWLYRLVVRHVGVRPSIFATLAPQGQERS